MHTTIRKFERKNSQENHYMVWNGATNRPVEKGLLSHNAFYQHYVKLVQVQRTVTAAYSYHSLLKLIEVYCICCRHKWWWVHHEIKAFIPVPKVWKWVGTELFLLLRFPTGVKLWSFLSGTTVKRKSQLRWFPSNRTRHRFPMKLCMLLLQDKEIWKT